VPAEIAVAYVSLVPSARGLSQAIHKELVGPTGQVAGEAGHAAGTNFGNRFTSAVSTIAKAGALGLAAVGFAATKLVIDAIGAAEESRKVAAQTTAVIQSTGAAANVSAAQVSELVDALSAKAGVDDELIQSGANVLLTFTKVRNEVGAGNDIFNQATAVALDMSVALGQDLQSSVTQIGKALNDPIAGLTALTRVGVQFTDQQKEQIKTLVESGDVLGAQKVILAELTTQFGGSAEAQATASGRLKVAFDNVSEAIGGVLLPYVDQFATWMLEEGVPLLQDKLVPAVGDLAEWIKTELVPAIRDELLPRLADFGTFVRDDMLPALQEMWRIFHDDILPVFTDVATFVRDELVPPLEDLKTALFGVNTEAGDGGPSLAGWAAALAAVAIGASFVAGALAPLVPVIKLVGLIFGQAIAVITYAAQYFAAVVVQSLLLSPLYKAIAGIILFRDEIGAAFLWVYQHVLVPIGRAFEDLWGVIIRAVGGILDFVARNWTTIGALLFSPFSIATDLIILAWDKIYAVVSAAVGAVVGFVADHWQLIVGYLMGPIGLAVTLISGAWDAIVGIFRSASGVVVAIWQGLWDAIWFIVQAAWTVLSSFFTALPGAIAGFFVSAGSWLLEGGRNIMRGLWNGINEIWGGITGFFAGVGTTIVDYFWLAGNWLYNAGKNVITGLWDGIKAVWSDVVGWFSDLPNKVLSALGIASPPQWAINAGRDILNGIMKGAGLGVGNVLDFMSSLAAKFTGPLKDAWNSVFGGGPDYGALTALAGQAVSGAAGVEKWRSTALAALAYTGQSSAWINDLLIQMMHESGGNARAINLTDINAQRGTPSMGLMQTIGSTFNAYAGELAGRGVWDPFANIVAAIRYTVSRYGSLGAWRARGFKGYDTGGVVPYTGLGFLHRDEVVFTPEQMRVLGSVMPRDNNTVSGQGRGRGIVVEQHNYGVTDYGEIARRSADELAWTLRVAG